MHCVRFHLLQWRTAKMTPEPLHHHSQTEEGVKEMRFQLSLILLMRAGKACLLNKKLRRKHRSVYPRQSLGGNPICSQICGENRATPYNYTLLWLRVTFVERRWWPSSWTTWIKDSRICALVILRPRPGRPIVFRLTFEPMIARVNVIISWKFLSRTRTRVDVILF